LSRFSIEIVEHKPFPVAAFLQLFTHGSSCAMTVKHIILRAPLSQWARESLEVIKRRMFTFNLHLTALCLPVMIVTQVYTVSREPTLKQKCRTLCCKSNCSMRSCAAPRTESDSTRNGFGEAHVTGAARYPGWRFPYLLLSSMRARFRPCAYIPFNAYAGALAACVQYD
jgi:hypothetical protein